MSVEVSVAFTCRFLLSWVDSGSFGVLFGGVRSRASFCSRLLVAPFLPSLVVVDFAFRSKCRTAHSAAGVADVNGQAVISGGVE